MEENCQDLDYSWQEQTYSLWSKNGFKGLLNGVPSAGKTIAACKAIIKYKQLFSDSEIWVVANTNEVLNQWKDNDLIKPFKIHYVLYNSAIKELRERTLDDEYNVPDLLVMDEVQAVLAPISGKILTFGVPHIMGLSGTPNGAEKVIGGVFQTVPWSQANISPITIHYCIFTPNQDEKDKYTKITKRIESYRENNIYSNFKNDSRLSLMYINRRSMVYSFRSRLPLALSLIKSNLGKRMMIFCERKIQVRELSNMLKKEGIEHCIHISGDEHLNDYIEGRVDISISCKKLKTGFSDPTTLVGIVVSTATSDISHIQTVGRIIRPMKGKEANVYVLLAKDTTDMELTKKNMFPKTWTQKTIMST